MIDLLAFHLNQALRHSPNDPELLALKGSQGDTLSDEEILRYLKDKMASGKVIHAFHGTPPPKTRASQG